MLVRNTNTKLCRLHLKDEIFQGGCCCNCRHRYILLSKGFPMGYLCKFKFDDSTESVMMKLSSETHAFCECYERVITMDNKD